MKCETCVRGIMVAVLSMIALYCFGMIPMNPEVGVAYFLVGLASLVFGVLQYVENVYIKPGRYTTVFEGR